VRLHHLFLSLAFASAASAAFLACVGDDPTVASSSPTPGGEAGADGGAPGDASTGTADDATTLDGGGGGDADAAPTFDVRSLAGLHLWLESSKALVPESVGSTGFGSWTDSSERWDGGASADAPDGGKHVAFPHNVNPPSIVANGFAGRPTVSFIDGNGYLQIANHEDFHFGLGDFLIVEVAKVSSGSGPLWNLRPGATAGSEESFAPGLICISFGIGVTDGCTAPAYSPTTQPHVFTARRKSDILTLRVDGTERATLDRSANPVDIFVNQFTAPYAFIGGSVTMQLSEVVVVVGPTPDADLAKLESHLETKYMITP
jgi:hypothetical protein